MNRTSAKSSLPAQQSRRWAPWWVYVLVIAPANLGKSSSLPVMRRGGYGPR